MSGKEFRVKMRGKVQVEDVTANEGTKAKPTEMLFNFCGLQLSCPFSWSHLSVCVRIHVCVRAYVRMDHLLSWKEGFMCICGYKISVVSIMPEHVCVCLCAEECVRRVCV